MEPEEYCTQFDIVIVDEAHHVASIPTDREIADGKIGMYYKFLTGCLSPMRIGLTATTDKDGSERAMAAEGLLGPVIGRFTFEDAVKAERIAKPRVKLIAVPINTNIRELSTYHDIYNIGVVFNRIRNNIVTDFIAEQAKAGKTSLAFVKLLEHADILVNLLKNKGVPCEYVSGEISGKERERIKLLLESGEVKCVVATSAWREGVNIPKLDMVINVAGYLSEKTALQMAGRALRVSEGKEEGVIVDFLDSGKVLTFCSVHALANVNFSNVITNVTFYNKDGGILAWISDKIVSVSFDPTRECQS
jgi:superfamily II DNA or RNA helicase